MRKAGAIYLVGPMGAGKSTIGKLLADALRSGFYDVDREIEARSGVDIPWIFDMEGESGFRARETSMLRDLSEDRDCVISTGGGAVQQDENRKLMVATGTVIYLRTSVDEQLRRTAKDRKRPLLQQGDPEETLRRLMAERDPLYREVADYTVETDHRSPKAVALELAQWLQRSDLDG
ncbi:shikimate kinase AroK [Spongiibacter nanhainus]|uniref:Shikimate kinase n=1 Tax=Spongiibacter nanhainus TaxID=2794344 RepID=A0A7T4R1Z6_9GAMM|nr:shikimate kinase AroK [Spongiibacter nanhainus]QQD18969.1 shikimate kinase AroK [Spongiibacter nanhainus]